MVVWVLLETGLWIKVEYDATTPMTEVLTTARKQHKQMILGVKFHET